MSVATDLLSTLAHRGITLSANDDRLTVEPATGLTDDDRAAIRQHKPALMEIIHTRAVGRQRLEAACARHGACLESALEWYTTDCLESMGDDPGLADMGVSDALTQKMIRKAAPAPAPTTDKPQATPGPLAGLALLHEDRQFIRARTQGRPDRDALLRGYRDAWLEAADAEPTPHKRDNVGRRAANAWLRETTDR